MWLDWPINCHLGDFSSLRRLFWPKLIKLLSNFRNMGQIFNFYCENCFAIFGGFWKDIGYLFQTYWSPWCIFLYFIASTSVLRFPQITSTAFSPTCATIHLMIFKENSGARLSLTSWWVSFIHLKVVNQALDFGLLHLLLKFVKCSVKTNFDMGHLELIKTHELFNSFS